MNRKKETTKAINDTRRALAVCFDELTTMHKLAYHRCDFTATVAIYDAREGVDKIMKALPK